VRVAEVDAPRGLRLVVEANAHVGCIVGGTAETKAFDGLLCAAAAPAAAAAQDRRQEVLPTFVDLVRGRRAAHGLSCAAYRGRALRWSDGVRAEIEHESEVPRLATRGRVCHRVVELGGLRRGKEEDGGGGGGGGSGGGRNKQRRIKITERMQREGYMFTCCVSELRS
jgi:hypothetical protein